MLLKALAICPVNARVASVLAGVPFRATSSRAKLSACARVHRELQRDSRCGFGIVAHFNALVEKIGLDDPNTHLANSIQIVFDRSRVLRRVPALERRRDAGRAHNGAIENFASGMFANGGNVVRSTKIYGFARL